jgi:hypothetical protein
LLTFFFHDPQILSIYTLAWLGVAVVEMIVGGSLMGDPEKETRANS